MQDKEEVISFVTEEVERVKTLFKDKEEQLVGERDAAVSAAKAAAEARQAAAQTAAGLREQLVAANAAAEVLVLVVLVYCPMPYL